MNRLRAIREFLEKHGFRWCCYVDGDKVIVDIPGEEFTVRTMKQAEWLVSNR